MTRVHTLVIVATLALLGACDSRPDFRKMTDTSERKQAFLDYFASLAQQANGEVAQERELLVQLAQAEDPDWYDRYRLDTLHARYGDVEAEAIDLAMLHRRIDTVPVPLVLAQAAEESGWGTSRFAVDAHNYFGMRCYEPGCGVVPKNRPASARFEVQRFDNPLHAVNAYLFNLNTHPRYRAFRMKRAALNEQPAQGQPRSVLLVDHLTAYSTDAGYAKRIKAMIRHNKLDRRYRL